jgi:TolB-like protein
LLGIAVLALVGVAFVLFRPRAQAGPASDAPSVAVLPFQNLTGDTTNNYLSDGLTEEVIDALVQMGLRVPSRTSSSVVGRKNLALPDIAKLLNVEYVVEGSLRRVGNESRVIAQLVKGSDDSYPGRRARPRVDRSQPAHDAGRKFRA